MPGRITVLFTAFVTVVEVRDASGMLIGSYRFNSREEGNDYARFLAQQPRYKGFKLELSRSDNLVPRL